VHGERRRGWAAPRLTRRSELRRSPSPPGGQRPMTLIHDTGEHVTASADDIEQLLMIPYGLDRRPQTAWRLGLVPCPCRRRFGRARPSLARCRRLLCRRAPLPRQCALLSRSELLGCCCHRASPPVVKSKFSTPELQSGGDQASSGRSRSGRPLVRLAGCSRRCFITQRIGCAVVAAKAWRKNAPPRRKPSPSMPWPMPSATCHSMGSPALASCSRAMNMASTGMTSSMSP
jgi:hypothetical protein